LTTLRLAIEGTGIFVSMTNQVGLNTLADLLLADPQVVEQLGFVLGGKSFDGFQFNDDLAEEEQVGLVFGDKFAAYLFRHAVAEHVVNLERRPHQIITFLLQHHCLPEK
jgi:hypothetical protein